MKKSFRIRTPFTFFRQTVTLPSTAEIEEKELNMNERKWNLKLIFSRMEVGKLETQIDRKEIREARAEV